MLVSQNNQNPFFQNTQPSNQQPGMRTLLNKFSSQIFIFVLFLSLSGIIAFFYFQNKNLAKENTELKAQSGVLGTSTNEESSKEYKEVLSAIQKLIKVDDGEKVNIARIDDPAKLTAQNAEFYKDAKVGDFLVVLPNSQRVIVFDKTENKIVNFSSYSIKVDLIPESEIAQSEKPLYIEIRYLDNVSQEAITNAQKNLQTASTNYVITNTIPVTSSTLNLNGVMLVLLNKDQKPKMSQNLIAHVGTTNIQAEIPSGEAASQADAIIYIGGK